MTKHRIVDTPTRSRSSVAQPRRRAASADRARTGAVAAVGIAILLVVGAGRAVTPRVSDSGSGELVYALWSNPVPSFLAGNGAATQARGVVPADPPRLLGVPDGSASAARKADADAGLAGVPAERNGSGSANAGSGSTTTAQGRTGTAGIDTPAAANGAGAGTRATERAARTDVAPGGGARAGAESPAGVRTTTSASAVAQAPAAKSGGAPIRVYFSRHPDSEATFTAVSPVKRIAPDRGVAAAALAELIDGPTTEERAAGYYSELGRALSGPSSCDGRDFQLSIRDGVATVRFCRSMTSAGIGQDARIRSQIEATLTQFSTIRSVRLLGADGHCLFDESGQDRCLAGTSPGPRSAGAATSR